MYYPTLFTDNFVEDLLDGIFKYPYDVKTKAEAHPLTGRMITDIKEYDDKYQLDMELPGFTKDDVKVELKEGYLIVSAERAENKDESEDDGKYIRKERYSGKMSDYHDHGKQNVYFAQIGNLYSRHSSLVKSFYDIGIAKRVDLGNDMCLLSLFGKFLFPVDKLKEFIFQP